MRRRSHHELRAAGGLKFLRTDDASGVDLGRAFPGEEDNQEGRVKVSGVFSLGYDDCGHGYYGKKHHYKKYYYGGHYHKKYYGGHRHYKHYKHYDYDDEGGLLGDLL
jgi:hypothetical protein